MNISDDEVMLNVTHLSIFTVWEEDDSSSSCSCIVGGGPITIMVLLILGICIGSFTFKCLDKETKNIPRIRPIFIIYPLTSLIYKQPQNRRYFIFMQVITTYLILLMFIGIFLNISLIIK